MLICRSAMLSCPPVTTNASNNRRWSRSARSNRRNAYRLKWIEEYLPPDDHDAHVAVRDRLPWQTLATGEHWYTAYPFQWAIRHRVADILQPDINWIGG